MSRLLCSLFLLLSLSASAEDQEVPEPGQPPAGTVPASPSQTAPHDARPRTQETQILRAGAVRWLKGTPSAGQAVHVRLRGEALKAVLDGQSWMLIVQDGRQKTVEAQAQVVDNLHTVSAALGPMKTGPTGESLWPLMVESDPLPLKKLKLSLQLPPGQAAPGFRLARLNADGSLAEVVADFTAGQAPPVWLEPDPQLRPELWAILVADGERPVQLRNITAFAAEVCLTFVVPDKGEVMLSSRAGESGADAAPHIASGTVEIAGEIDSVAQSTGQAQAAGLGDLLSLAKPKKQLSQPGTESAVPAGQSSASTLLLGILYGALGMAMLIGGFSLLRRKVAVD